MRTILVTGSSGTVGTRLCERLLERGDDVVGVDWRDNAWVPAVEDITIKADIRDADVLASMQQSLKDTGKTIDTVVHMAANARVHDLVLDPSLALDNVTTTFNMLEFARRGGIGQFIFPSSRETYGNAQHDRYDESLVRVENCESPYSASKIAGEALVHSYAKCYGLRPVIFRFSNIYGMYDDSDRVIPLFIRHARKNETLTIFGAEKCLDFTYIDDAVNGVITAIDRFERVAGRTFNLGCEEGTTIRTLAEQIKELCGSTSSIEMGTPRTGEIIHYIADTSAARTLLDYRPTLRIEEGLEKTVEWYRTHP